MWGFLAAATKKRHEQGWVMEVYTSLDDVVARIKKAKQAKETLSMAYQVWLTTAIILVFSSC
jgi:urocanate hydratase